MTSELQTSSEINKFFDDYTKLFDARDGTSIRKWTQTYNLIHAHDRWQLGWRNVSRLYPARRVFVPALRPQHTRRTFAATVTPIVARAAFAEIAGV